MSGSQIFSPDRTGTGYSPEISKCDSWAKDIVSYRCMSGKTDPNVRVENLTDTFYQDAVNASSGYATRGRGYYLTLQSEL